MSTLVPPPQSTESSQPTRVHVPTADDRILPGGLEDVHGDPPIAAVRTAAADRDEPPSLREPPHRCLGHGPTGPRHQLVDVVAGLGGAHLVRRVERSGVGHLQAGTVSSTRLRVSLVCPLPSAFMT